VAKKGHYANERKKEQKDENPEKEVEATLLTAGVTANKS
jgi:hypothetical protein